jgi:uncharacterized surface protein with fasciclin (FAS1) repeats
MFMRMFLILFMFCIPLNALAQNNVEDSLRRPADEQSVIEYLQKSKQHTLFVNALKLTGYDAELDENLSWTVFAPVNSAFAKMPRTQVYALFEPKNRIQLNEFVENHIQKDGLLITSQMPIGASRFIVKNGREIVISKTPSGVTVNNGYVFQPDIRVRNGVIHGIDTILMQ